MESKTLIINTTRLHFQFFKSPAQVGITIIFNIFLLFFPQYLSAQKEGYTKVLDQDERLSGTFGEIRSNHFHSGTDYKTDGKEGLAVCAAADGYVSRVKVSSVGYGKALYINHPDGTTTVYAHLRAFYPAIADSLRNLQYTKQEFEQEFFPDSNLFPVKCGQLIGFSGNSGGSEGPHLHFETRNTLTEKPFRPDKIGYHSPDSIPPLITAIVIYEPGPDKGLYGSTRTIVPLEFPESPSLPDTLKTVEEFFIGFESHDLAGIETNQIGINGYRLFMNDSLVYACKIDEFAFDETRMVNACIDYPFKQDSGRTIILCTRLPGNESTFLGPGSGLIHFYSGNVAVLKLEVEDIAGNISKLNFVVQKNPEQKGAKQKMPGFEFKFGAPLSIIEEKIRVKIPEKAFYENVTINLSKTNQIADQSYSAVYAFAPGNLAVNKPIEISIQPIGIEKNLESKLLIAKVDSSGRLRYVGGKFANGWVTSTTRSTGNFTVAIDSTGPEALKPYWKPDELTRIDQLIIPVNDNLSGITKYRCQINGEWVCGEYNASKSEIAIYFDQLLPVARPFRLKIDLTDQKGNYAEWMFNIEK